MEVLQVVGCISRLQLLYATASQESTAVGVWARARPLSVQTREFVSFDMMSLGAYVIHPINATLREALLQTTLKAGETTQLSTATHALINNDILA